MKRLTGHGDYTIGVSVNPLNPFELVSFGENATYIVYVTIDHPNGCVVGNATSRYPR